MAAPVATDAVAGIYMTNDDNDLPPVVFDPRDKVQVVLLSADRNMLSPAAKNANGPPVEYRMGITIDGKLVCSLGGRFSRLHAVGSS
jgi:hypothetical protein